MITFKSLFLTALAAATLATSPAVSSDGLDAENRVQMWECRIVSQSYGYQEANARSSLVRMGGNGAVRILERGDVYYTGDNMYDPTIRWVSLFGALRGHGSSWVGFVPRNKMRCVEAAG